MRLDEWARSDTAVRRLQRVAAGRFCSTSSREQAGPGGRGAREDRAARLLQRGVRRYQVDAKQLAKREAAKAAAARRGMVDTMQRPHTSTQRREARQNFEIIIARLRGVLCARRLQTWVRSEAYLHRRKIRVRAAMLVVAAGFRIIARVSAGRRAAEQLEQQQQVLRAHGGIRQLDAVAHLVRATRAHHNLAQVAASPRPPHQLMRGHARDSLYHPLHPFLDRRSGWCMMRSHAV